MKIAFVAMALVAARAVAAQEAPTRIVDEAKLGSTYVLAAGAMRAAPGYPAAYAATRDDVCIALGYTVKPDGSTGDFRLLRAWSSDPSHAETSNRYLDTFAAAAVDAVSQWRFVPKGDADARPASTVATLAFRGRGEARKLADRCRIGELANYYRGLKRLENGQMVARAASDRQRVVHMAFAAAYYPQLASQR